MNRQRASSAMRTVQRAVLVLLAVWVAVHTVLVLQTGWSPWRLGGLGMYTKPGPIYGGATVVVCDAPGCEPELRMAESMAPPTARQDFVPVLAWSDARAGFAPLLAELPNGWNRGVRRFLNFPTASTADLLVRSRLTDPCGPYLAVHYHQHVSLITRQTTVDTRPFVVSLPGTRCGGRPAHLPPLPG